MSGTSPHSDREGHTIARGGYAVLFDLCDSVFAEVRGILPALGPTLRWRIRQCLLEAVGNAIQHGNRGDPNREVHIRWHVRGGVLEVGVADEGAPWRPDFKRIGRGLGILVRATQGVRYDKDANEIVMRFHVQRRRLQRRAGRG